MTSAQTHEPKTIPVSEDSVRAKAVHQMQKSQGDQPCFKTVYKYFCDPASCVWRGECIGTDFNINDKPNNE